MTVSKPLKRIFSARFVWFLSVVLSFSLILVSNGCFPDDSAGPDEIVLQQRSRSKIQTMDPANIGDVPSDEVGREFFETLYYYHYLKRPYQMVPQLAAAMPEISEDGCTYTIPIRQDVYFHDDPCFPEGKGRRLTAHDFAYAIKRIANVKTLSQNWWIFDERIIGLNEFREYTKYYTIEGQRFVKPWQIDDSVPVEGLQAPDDFTLQIKLTKPWPQLVLWLGHIASAPVAREAVEYYHDDVRSHPVGTGAYIMKTWNKGSYIEAVRNPNYRLDFYPTEGMPEDAATGRLADAGKQVPFIDRIIWRIIEEDQSRWLMLMRGRIDLNTIPKDNFGQAIAFGKTLTDEMTQRGIQLQDDVEPDVFYLGFNMNDPLLGQNKSLRYAINYAIDREKYIDLLFNGRGVVAHGFISPAMADYDPNVAQYSHSRLDLDEARRCLKEAEKIIGGPIPSLTLAVSGTDTTYRQIGEFIQRNLHEIGLDVQLDMFDWPTFLEKMKKNQLQLYMAGWQADYPDTESFLEVFYSKNAPWPNSSQYSSPEFDALFERISVMPESPQRTELYRQAEQIVMKDMPVSFIFHRIAYVLYYDWLENFKINAYKSDCLGGGFAKYWKIDKGKREQYWKQYK